MTEDRKFFQVYFLEKETFFITFFFLPPSPGFRSKEINKQANRCGQVCRDRFKSPALQSEQDLVKEMIYHDLNEVRAG